MEFQAQSDIKTKILTAAIYLFNHFGFVNVRLQHIADEVGMSVGNLAYHFKSKNVLLETIYQSVKTGQENLINESYKVDSFSVLNNQLGETFALQQQYSFFFTDTLDIIRTFPTLRRVHRKQIEWQIGQVEDWLTYNSSRGALRLPDAPGSWALVAHRCTLLTESWMSFERMRGVDVSQLTSPNFQAAVWSLLMPYFTQLGTEEFIQL